MASAKLDRFLNSQTLSASIFLITGANKTYNDYISADESYKSKFLLKDTAILAGAGLGMALQKKYSSKLVDAKTIQTLISNMPLKLPKINFISKFQTPVMYTREVLTDLLKNISMFVSGILGALVADLIISQFKFLQPEMVFKIAPDDNVLLSMSSKLNSEIGTMQNFIDKKVDSVIVNKDIKNAVYERITDMPQLGILTSSLAGSSAIDLGKETELKTKLQHTGTCIINNSILPMLYLAIANVLTKNLKSYKKVLAVFSILVGGTLITSKLTDMNIKNLSQQKLKKYLDNIEALPKSKINQIANLRSVYGKKNEESNLSEVVRLNKNFAN